jgi:peptidylprolyl isomerase
MENITKSKKILGIIAVCGVSALALSACSTDGGVKNTKTTSTPTSQATTPTNAPTGGTQVTTSSIPTVTGAAGKEPTIAAPQGAAPTIMESKDIIVGTGAVAVATSTLTVHYTLMAWSTGKIVETSYTGGNPATFPLAQVIPGWQQGIPGMKVGGRRELVIPPALAYGAAGAGASIKPNETLIFVVDLLGVK